MKITKLPNFSRNRKIHNPFKKRNSSSKSTSHSHSVHQQNVISALGGIPHDFDYDFQSATTETPTAYSSRRSSIYSISSTDLRIDPDQIYNMGRTFR
ncbi:10614_t:CDS:2 [Diversispora eburnea]|uniref:10614_t:CDS:1 n=1 Tax=Diversispora eburnea TaxID=1213867 RepID=A0A9N8WAB9_9GLOM|nr:10614_t:CDS:2 [Diversispora eburnea]